MRGSWPPPHGGLFGPIESQMLRLLAPPHYGFVSILERPMLEFQCPLL